MPLKNPPHPGEFIRTEIIKVAGLSVTAAAAGLQVSCPALSSFLNGKAGLSSDMALRQEAAIKLIYLALQNVAKKWHTVQGWREALRQFSVRWPDRIEQARAA